MGFSKVAVPEQGFQACDYMGAFERPDGYNGATVVVHLLSDPNGAVLAAVPCGYFNVTCHADEKVPAFYVPVRSADIRDRYRP